MTKTVDITVSYPVHVVVYTVPSLRRPPVLLVLTQVMRGGELQNLPRYRAFIVYIDGVVRC